MTPVIIAVVSAIVGFVAGVFVYRNNTKEISKIADKVDELYDKIEAKIEETKK